MESQRSIVFHKPGESWVLADVAPGQDISIVRYFSSYEQAKNWHTTYGFPMIEADETRQSQTEPDRAGQSWTELDGAPQLLQPKQYKHDPDIWYNNL